MKIVNSFGKIKIEWEEVFGGNVGVLVGEVVDEKVVRDWDSLDVVELVVVALDVEEAVGEVVVALDVEEAVGEVFVKLDVGGIVGLAVDK